MKKFLFLTFIIVSFIGLGCSSSEEQNQAITTLILAFLTPPSESIAGATISEIQVQIQDQDGNVDTSATNTITLAIGTNPASASLNGTTSKAAVDGVATFDDINIEKVGIGYTLTASADTFDSVTSDAFNITPATASQLSFSIQPSNIVAATSISPAIVVQVLDQFGNLETNANDTITLAIGTNPASASLNGTTSKAAVGGVATFSDINIEKVGTGYTLTASAGVFDSVTSDGFNITPAAASQLSFSIQPSNTASFTPISPAIVVQVLDQFGNLVANANNTVTLSIANNPGELILHNSGTSAPNTGGEERLFELVDPGIPLVLTWLEKSPDNRVIGMVYSSDSDVILGSENTSNDFLSFNPVTAEETELGDGVLDDFKGIAFDSAGTLHGLPSSNTSRNVTDQYTINPSDGTLSVRGPITPSTGTINGFDGLALDPTDNTLYAVTNLGGAGLTGRGLMTFNPPGKSVTLVGDMGDSVAGITVAKDGTMYAVTDDGATTSETLFTVNKSTGAMTMLLTLGNGDAGESITMVPARASGTLSVAAVNGVATFSNVKLNAVASGYTLTASDELSSEASGLVNATSNSFNVTAPTPAGAVQFSNTSQTVSETVGTVMVSLTVDSAQSHDITVTMSLGGTASDSQAGSPDFDLNRLDFVNATIPAGSTSTSVSFNVVNDATVEADETVILFIENASLSGSFGANRTHTVTIQSDD